MTTYFAWIQPGEKYDPSTHNREDLQIFRLDIQEKEGTYPFATCLIKKPETGFEDKSEALISQEGTLLFRGSLLKSPLKIADDLMEIKLIAKPKDSATKLEALCKALKKEALWDPLFISNQGSPKPNEVLDARSQLFYWSRTTGDVKASCVFEGSKSATFGKSIFYDSLKYTVARTPLSALHLQISAEWLQECKGVHDIGHLIKYKFPEGIISTLTGESLKRLWWKSGEKLGRSGYTLRKSKLEQVTPPNTGGLNLYPRTSIKLWENEKPYTLRRSWFRVRNLELKWSYKQKRREIVHIHLSQDLQDLGLEPRKKSLKIRLQNIGSPKGYKKWSPNHRYSRGFKVKHKKNFYQCVSGHTSKEHFEETKWLKINKKVIPTLISPTFFNTDRGHQAVAHALEVAKSHLAYSARAIEIRVQVPFEKARKITCDHKVTIKDDRLPDGKAVGKVKRLKLSQDGETGISFGEITIACSIGKDQKKPNFKKAPNPYVEESYIEPDYLLDTESEFVSPSHIGFGAWEDQQPLHGLLNPDCLRASDMVEEIEVINPPEKQNEALRSVQMEGRKAALGVLKGASTQIKIRLKDLKSTGVLTHHINVPIKTPFTPPQQIDLKG